MRTILIVFVGALFVTVVIIALITLAMFSEPNLTLDLKRFYFNAYKAVGIGFLVALLATIVPQMLPEARDKFERFKDSRVKYSQAKTSVIYLPERIATLSFEDAILMVQDAHEKLHLAETYKKELRKHLKWYPYPKIWSEQMYWEITAVKTMLKSKVDIWPNMNEGEHMRVLCNVVDVVKKVYAEEDGKRSKEARESQIRSAIDSVTHMQEPQGNARNNTA